ncbi:MAG TPA: NAD(P)-dependent oxidoreductase [Pseudonocardiaceae bacterium]|jgi:nucleoside-diphosphate-sugar epimerase|nr:NAD(P)-dependent oxidoreductase [Pseudonocardiaceae bacterium]
MRRVLVIGAGGYLGRNVLDLLRTAPDLLVRTASRSAPSVGGNDRRLDLSTEDGELDDLLVEEAPEVVVNCAGAVAGTDAELTAANVTGPANLVAALARVRPGCRLIHLGSAAEYGVTEIGVPITEGMAGEPAGGYGHSKLAGTQLVVLGRSVGLETVVLRVFNPIGPCAPASSLPGRVVAELRRAAEEADDIRLGPLGSVRDFVDVRDIAEAVLAAVNASSIEAPVLNLASGIGTPIRSIVDELADIAGFTGTVLESSAGSSRSAAVPWQQADITAISTSLGWKPRVALLDSLADLWRSAR